MGRPPDKHIDSEELSILVDSPSNAGTGEMRRHSVEALRDVHRHLAKCSACRKRLMMYRRIVGGLSSARNSGIAAAGSSCPRDVDWAEVVAGLWPDMKTQQLISHAAVCDHCGPMLRSATRLASEKRSEQSAKPPFSTGVTVPAAPRRHLLAWLVPLCSAVMILAVLVGVPLSSPIALSGTNYAEFAAQTHVQHAQGQLALEVRSDSQQAVNDWLRKNVQFPISLPASPGAPAEKRPYRIEGARIVQVAGKRAAFIAYQMDSGPATLMIAPYEVAVASGGVEAHFKKVTFHYRMVDGLKVVTWSQHGLTYALVSQEGTGSQKSCMVCHSAMQDRDLSQTPTPLSTETKAIRSYLQ